MTAAVSHSGDFPLLKVSGKAYAPTAGFVNEDVRLLAERLQFIIEHRGTGMAVVSGAGNIWRGDYAPEDLKETGSDLIHWPGMTATIVNGQCLAMHLHAIGVESMIMSAFDPLTTNPVGIDHERARSLMAEGVIVIFVGGTGGPGVTTDTGVALRAAACGITEVWVAKDQAEGVYDADPRHDPDARLIPKISLREILDRDLKVMDREAFEIGLQHGITFRIFGGAPHIPWQTIATPEPQIQYSIVHP